MAIKAAQYLELLAPVSVAALMQITSPIWKEKEDLRGQYGGGMKLKGGKLLMWRKINKNAKRSSVQTDRGKEKEGNAQANTRLQILSTLSTKQQM